jgi:hypothetical protein
MPLSTELLDCPCNKGCATKTDVAVRGLDEELEYKGSKRAGRERYTTEKHALGSNMVFCLAPDVNADSTGHGPGD